MSVLTGEPADGQFVVWFDRNGDPEAVFWRADRHADIAGADDRWLRADQSAEDGVEPWTWKDLCAEMDRFDGPYLLTLAGESA